MGSSSALALGLAAAGLWGASGFIGGLAARASGALVVAAGAQLAGLVVVVAALGASTPPPPPAESLLPALAGGLAGGLGLVVLFRALAVGQMGLAAPIAGTGIAVPILAGLAVGERLSAYQAAGVLVAGAGVFAASLTGSRAGALAHRPHGVGLAAVAAALFGLFYLGLAAGDPDSVLWTVCVARVLSVAVLVTAVVVRRRGRPALPRAAATGIGASGALDVAGNAVFALATAHGVIAQASVPAALYPLVTLLLARAVVGERLQGRRRAGAMVALAGLGLMAVPA